MSKKILLCLLFLAHSFFVLSAVPDSQSDSLTFIHTKSDEKVILTKGTLVEVITNEKQKTVGEFIEGSINHILLEQNGANQKIIIGDIKKLIIHKEGSKDPITGTVRFVVSASRSTSLLLGAGAAAGGIATVKNNSALGVGLIAASIPLIYYGLKLHFMLKNAGRDVVKPGNGWKVSTPAE